MAALRLSLPERKKLLLFRVLPVMGCSGAFREFKVAPVACDGVLGSEVRVAPAACDGVLGSGEGDVRILDVASWKVGTNIQHQIGYWASCSKVGTNIQHQIPNIASKWLSCLCSGTFRKFEVAPVACDGVLGSGGGDVRFWILDIGPRVRMSAPTSNIKYPTSRPNGSRASCSGTFRKFEVAPVACDGVLGSSVRT